MNKISIFGNSGFIGSRFCEKYYQDVVKINRNSRHPETNNILNFISTTDNYNIYESPKIDIETNVLIMLEILDEARKKYDNDFIFTQVSSWFCYGKTKLPAKENAHCNPRGFYSISKLMAEQLLISFCETFKINYRIFRLSNVIGETDLGVSKKKNALQYLINEIKSNRNINLYHGGDFIRDYMYVTDVCSGIYLCMNKAPLNTIINIGSGNPYNFLELMNYCKNKSNSTSEFITVEPTEFHKIVQVKDMYLDTTKLKDLGFQSEYSIYEALDKLL